MKSGFCICPAEWEGALPPGMTPLREGVPPGRWDLLVLTEAGLGRSASPCGILLVPGDCPAELLERVPAETVVTYGMSPRDSLTFSSLEGPVLCIQRRLPRLDGTVVEPQEVPLPGLSGPPELLLPVLGARVLQMPLPVTWAL